MRDVNFWLELKILNPERTDAYILVDCTGLRCPQPVIRIKRALSKLEAGKQILAICTDELAAIDVPHFASAFGHGLVSQKREAEKLYFVIEKGVGN
jgi:tRNA 2-thiouridine synthesizing protein A